MGKEILLKAIGGRLEELRGTQTQVAVLCKIQEIVGKDRLKTKEAYQHYEAGRRMLPSDILLALCEIFETTPAWIWKGEGPRSIRKRPDSVSGAKEDKQGSTVTPHVPSEEVQLLKQFKSLSKPVQVVLEQTIDNLLTLEKGQGENKQLTKDEKTLLEHFREASPKKRKIMMNIFSQLMGDHKEE